ncbi:MAG: isoprenylcysteine carboxylmethyltransferase family protein [Gammaproteobacteria bacterium]|nr:isoprenylcysteine carboxylmethyltransferase family protein [Gammaproteobacteria bacterium]
MDRTGKRPPDDRDDALPFRPVPRLALILSAAIGSTALLAFTVFLFTGPWHPLVFFRDTGAVLVFDACLSAAFFAQHSGMVRNSFKAWFGRLAPEYYHGAIFSIASGICLYGVILFWQVSEQTLITAGDALRPGLRALFLAALGGIVWSNLVLHSFDSFGLRAIRRHLRGKSPPAVAFMERGPYQWVRHPQYFCVLVMIWSCPDLTADRLLFNVLWSAWIVVGTRLEERDLTATFGDDYREYQSRVPMLIPSLARTGTSRHPG